jgi:protein gp37
MHPEWVRSLRDQCAEYSVPFLFKQWGEFRPPLDEEEWNDAERRGATYGGSLALSGKFINRGGGMLRVGKKAAGRMLDGKTHTGFPSHG